MKQFLKIGFLVLSIVFGMSTAKGQIFYGGIGVIGTSNAVVQNSFQIQTNFAFVSLPARTLQLQNITTNQTTTVAYGMQFSGQGFTNMMIAVTNQFTFPASNGFVQGQTWTTNFPAFSFAIPITPVGQIQIYTNSGANAYSNNVLFQ